MIRKGHINGQLKIQDPSALLVFYLSSWKLDDAKHQDSNREGILLSSKRLVLRHEANILQPLADTPSSLYRKHCSFACMTMTKRDRRPLFNLLIFTDEGQVRRPEKRDWNAHGIGPCGRAIGVAQFLAAIAVLVEIWDEEWRENLSHIDIILSGQVGNRQQYPCALSSTLLTTRHHS